VVQLGLDVDETCSETSDGYFSVPGRSADVDLRIIHSFIHIRLLSVVKKQPNMKKGDAINSRLFNESTIEPFGTKVVHLGQRRIGEKRD